MCEQVRSGIRNRGRAVSASSILAALLTFFGCSQSGTLSGDVTARNQSGDVVRGARISVFLVLPSDAFEREWADALAAFRQEVAPAAEAHKAAARRAEEARLAWDRALAASGKSSGRRGQWTLTLRDVSVAGSQQLWRNVRGTEAAAFQARKRVAEIVRRHEEQAHILVEKHATQRVQTDEAGRYVIVKVPSGKAYVYSRLQEKTADAVWFLSIQVESGTQRADLTQDNQRNWSFVP